MDIMEAVLYDQRHLIVSTSHKTCILNIRGHDAIQLQVCIAVIAYTQHSRHSPQAE